MNTTLDERGEKTLLKGEFHNTVFIVGIVLGIIGIILSILYLTGENAAVFAGIDYIIIIFSIVFIFVCIKELVLNRKRMIGLTDSKVFGNTGYKSFDILYSNIAEIEERVKRSFMYGNNRYLYIKTVSNTEINIEQLKNTDKIIQFIKSKRG